MNQSPMPTALVTGGSGFIGSHLVEHLAKLGWQVRCLLRESSSRRNFPGAGVAVVGGDLVSGDGLADATAEVDYVFHLAGVTKAYRPEDYLAGNARGTGNLLTACTRNRTPRCRFVHASSLAAIGPSPDGKPLNEDAPPNPITHYGRSKLAAEQAVRESELFPKAVILRPPVVYGPRDTDVFQVLWAIRHGLLIEIGRLESYFSYLFVGDLVEAMVLAAQTPDASSKCLFVANRTPVAWREFADTAAGIFKRSYRPIRLSPWAAMKIAGVAELISRARRKPGILSRDKVREAEQRYWVCDASRAQQQLGWSAPTSLADGLRVTLEWYREVRWLTW